jgi:flavin reductase (DIM6/NTAB) family NADH-FMN oxidoreductase RutF
MDVTTLDVTSLMAGFPTGVAVITTFARDGTPWGMTCSSLCSVTLEPPTLLVCLRRGSPTLRSVLEHRAFSVNLLAEQARSTAELFSSGEPRRFDRVPWAGSAERDAGPHLVDCAHGFADCELIGDREVGTHQVLFGRVLDVRRLREPQPLLYGLRTYAGWAGRDRASARV